MKTYAQNFSPNRNFTHLGPACSLPRIFLLSRTIQTGPSTTAHVAAQGITQIVPVYSGASTQWSFSFSANQNTGIARSIGAFYIFRSWHRGVPGTAAWSITVTSTKRATNIASTGNSVIFSATELVTAVMEYSVQCDDVLIYTYGGTAYDFDNQVELIGVSDTAYGTILFNSPFLNADKLDVLNALRTWPTQASRSEFDRYLTYGFEEERIEKKQEAVTSEYADDHCSSVSLGSLDKLIANLTNIYSKIKHKQGMTEQEERILSNLIGFKEISE